MKRAVFNLRRDAWPDEAFSPAGDRTDGEGGGKTGAAHLLQAHPPPLPPPPARERRILKRERERAGGHSGSGPPAVEASGFCLMP